MMFRNSLIKLILILIPLNSIASVEDFFTIDKSYKWRFFWQESEKYSNIDPNIPLLYQKPNEISSCVGFYDVSISKDVFNGKNLNNLALFIPRAYNIPAVVVNDFSTDISSDKYSGAGPIVPLNLEKIKENNIRIKIFVNSKGCYWVGGILWSAPIIAELQDIILFRDKIHAHQETISMVVAAFLFFLLIVFIFLYRHLGSTDPVVRETIVALLVWILFFLFLSGKIRNLFPLYGLWLHFTVRCIAGAIILRFTMLVSGIEYQKVKRISMFPSILAIISIIFYKDFKIQSYCYMFINFSFFIIVLRYILPLNISLYFRGVAFIASLGYINDVFVLFSPILGFNFHNIFLNRYVTPPLLLLSIFYISKKLIEKNDVDQRRNALEDIVHQVNHDIQSPIAALSAISSISNLPEEIKKITEYSTDRLKKMLDTLVIELKEVNALGGYNINTIIKNALDEKKMEFRECNINFTFESDIKEIECNVELLAFSRVISNLLNNAAEAVKEKENGKISVCVFRENNAFIVIEDNGIGIPKNNMKNIGTRGISFGKKYGKGLGLYYAKKTIQAWNGRLLIESIEGKGTKISIILPILEKNIK